MNNTETALIRHAGSGSGSAPSSSAGADDAQISANGPPASSVVNSCESIAKAEPERLSPGNKACSVAYLERRALGRLGQADESPHHRQALLLEPSALGLVVALLLVLKVERALARLGVLGFLALHHDHRLGA